MWIQYTISHNGFSTNVIVLILRSLNGGSESRLVITYSENYLNLSRGSDLVKKSDIFHPIPEPNELHVHAFRTFSVYTIGGYALSNGVIDHDRCRSSVYGDVHSQVFPSLLIHLYSVTFYVFAGSVRSAPCLSYLSTLLRLREETNPTISVAK